MVLKIALCLLSGLSNAVMDTLTHHHSTSIFKANRGFWGPASETWVRKYKLNDPRYGRRKIFGAIPIPVLFSDAWHLGKSLMLVFLCLAIALPIDLAWYWDALGCRLLFGIGFTLGYNWLFVRK